MARRPGAPSPMEGPAHLIELIRSTIPPMHPAGRPFVATGLGVALAGRNVPWLRRAGLLAAGACAGFFREPSRVPPQQSDVVVAAGDGVVCVIDAAAPPAELGLGPDPLPRVSIFLSVFDVHVQRFPISGEVVAVRHRPGRFRSADRPEASDDNERNSLHIRTENGADVVVVQIAGLLARRIVCTARAGDKLTVGQTYGLIRFGSRVDTYFPVGTEPDVRLGQRTVGGETVLAELS